MTFVESIKTCFSKYADFNGCAIRSEFWWWALFHFLVMAILGAISETLSGIFALATLLPYIAVTARRLHDTDRTGWLQLIVFIPLIGIIVLIIFCAQAGKPSRFCSPGDTQAA